MKLLRFDSVGGASGDMILGALVGLGVPAESLNRMLAGLGLGDVHVHAEPAASHGLNGLRVHVHAHDHGHHHHEDHAHAHGEEHAHDHEHGHGHHHHHAEEPHRGFTEIRGMIEGSDLPAAVKEQAVAVFRRLGEAEAAIHGVPLEKIHFHEVGAADSIADIVGACVGRATLGVDAVSVGPLPLGHGTVQCAHGVYPSPAPATLRLLQGMAVEEVDEPFETVTPTGAALLATWKTHERIPAGFRPVASAYSFGMRKLNGRPNVLRATIYESAPAEESDSCLVLECNLDDTTPELIGVLCEGLMQAGALDAFASAIQMKKQRPATLLSVLCRAEDRERMLERIFRGSTTFGVREYEARRTVLARRWIEVETPYGPVRVKVGTWKGADITRAPEMDDCRRAAETRGVEVRAVYEAAFASANR